MKQVYLRQRSSRPFPFPREAFSFPPFGLSDLATLGLTTVQSRKRKVLSQKRKLGLELLYLRDTCFRPYRTIIPPAFSQRRVKFPYQCIYSWSAFIYNQLKCVNVKGMHYGISPWLFIFRSNYTSSKERKNNRDFGHNFSQLGRKKREKIKL